MRSFSSKLFRLLMFVVAVTCLASCSSSRQASNKPKSIVYINDPKKSNSGGSTGSNTNRTGGNTTTTTTTTTGKTYGASDSMAGAKAGSKQTGKASYYADKFQGRSTANGESFDQKKLTCAHRTLPFGSVVRVTNKSNGKSVEVRVNDRGPFAAGRIVDLSRSAAEKIGLIQAGVADVTLQVISVP